MSPNGSTRGETLHRDNIAKVLDAPEPSDDDEAEAKTDLAAGEEIYQALKRGESVTLRNFGTLYVRPERSSWAFKFNPSQRLRKLSPPTKGSYERLTSIAAPSGGAQPRRRCN